MFSATSMARRKRFDGTNIPAKPVSLGAIMIAIYGLAQQQLVRAKILSSNRAELTFVSFLKSTRGSENEGSVTNRGNRPTFREGSTLATPPELDGISICGSNRQTSYVAELDLKSRLACTSSLTSQQKDIRNRLEFGLTRVRMLSLVVR
jgi:hypothetical protein